MSDLTNLTANLATMKTAMYDRLVAQGDTTIQANDSMATYMNHFQYLYIKGTTTLNITENGIYTATNQEISGYANINVNVPSGGGATHKRYNLFDRIYADSNDSTGIGTVCGFYKDSNSVEYAVVCLDAIYRKTGGQWASASGAITNMPLYRTWNSNVNGTETATENTTLILASKTSSACSHCRDKSFTIGGITYYGQLPNISELLMISGTHAILYNMDPTVSSVASGLNFVQNGFPGAAWSSTQCDTSYGWYINSYGAMNSTSKSTGYFVCPVLEIPNTL